MRKGQYISLFIAIVLLLSACSSASTLPSASTEITSIPETTGNAVGEPVAPGTLRDPELVPQPETTDVGKQVTLSVDALLNVSDNATEHTFVYLYSRQHDVGRLFVFCDPDIMATTTKVIVYAPEFAGIDGLCHALQGDFSAQITDILNVTFEEGMYMRNSTFFTKENAARYLPEEIVFLTESVQPAGDQSLQFCFGYIKKGQSSIPEQMQAIGGHSLFLTANMASVNSEVMDSSIRVFNRIADRFELCEFLP